MGMTQRLKGIDNIRRAMERRVEEREDVMRAEAVSIMREPQAKTPAGEDSSIS